GRSVLRCAPPAAPSRRAREARVAGECRRGGGYATASGAPAHDVFGMSGGRQSLPPVKTGADKGPWFRSTGGRAAGREARPAAEQPGISTGHTIARASRPTAEQPGISTGRQNQRAAQPAARAARRRQLLGDAPVLRLWTETARIQPAGQSEARASAAHIPGGHHRLPVTAFPRREVRLAAAPAGRRRRGRAGRGPADRSRRGRTAARRGGPRRRCAGHSAAWR
ncbi:MAG: hypothetical protein QOG45_2456, partial [Chloroflexota bacterium]|nr:hypothetical protein [Chloroflexota bacterium]